MKNLATFLLLLSAKSIFAQSHVVSFPQKTKKFNIQFEAGLNNFRNYGDPIFDRYDVSQSHYEAVSIERRLNQVFSVSFGIRNINYCLKSTSEFTDNNGNPTGEYFESKYNYWTIQTPLQIKFKPFQMHDLSLNFGGYLGFNYYNYATSSSPKFEINQNEDKYLMDKGILVGVDYKWLKKGNFTLGNSLSYYAGLSDLNPMPPFLVAFGIPHITTKAQGLAIGFTGTFGF